MPGGRRLRSGLETGPVTAGEIPPVTGSHVPRPETGLSLPGLIGLAGGSPTAGAFSRPGLPVEYLQVPSGSMGRDIKIQTGARDALRDPLKSPVTIVSRVT